MSRLKYPKNEIVCTSYYDVAHKLKYIVTTKMYSIDSYFLYEYVDGQFKKLGKAKTPTELEIKFDIDNKIKN